MQKVSRSLLLAGVLAFGTLVAACGDKVEVAAPVPAQTGIFSVTVSPSNATINVGATIQLAVSVTGDATTDKTVVWSSSSPAVATVDAAGKVTGVTAGTVTVTATSKADASKASAAAITVQAVSTPITVPPSIAINSVTTSASGISVPVNLSNVVGQIDITVNTSGGGLIEVFLSASCSTNTISASDGAAVASQSATSAQAGSVTLSVNTAQLTSANVPRFPNGNYCVKARLTNGATVVVATNTVPLTLNNINVFKATLSFASQTGGPTSAVSSINGLNYNQGTATVTITPVIFTGTSPAALISGYLSRDGEQNGAGSPSTAAFTNIAVASGTATIAFTDTGSSAGVRSIFAYQSLPAGDTLFITSITDASGNPITVTPTPGFPGFSVPGVQGVRIDNDAPTLATVIATGAPAYTVTAPNGYIGAAYSFASGTGGAGTTASTDTKGLVPQPPPGGPLAPVPGVGGITTTYYVGAAGGTIFNGSAATLCTTTGLTKAAVGTDLANTFSITTDQAKVVVSDALGNSICAIVPVTTVTGSPVTFGVDKIAPILTPSTANGGVANNGVSGNVATPAAAPNFSFIYNDSISGFDPTKPFKATLVKNFFTSTAAADCVIGTYSVTAKTCSQVNVDPTAAPNSTFGTPPNAGGSVPVTGVAAPTAANNGYYTITATPVDRALNVGATVSTLAIYDITAPTLGALTQSPAAVASLGTVTVSGAAADNLDLAGSSGNLSYAPAGSAIGTAVFATQAGTTFGTGFKPATVTSGTASVALPNVYRGMQGVDATNTIIANAATPTATVTVTDVASNPSAAAATVVATSTTSANILIPAAGTNKWTVTPTSGGPTTRQTSTTLTMNVVGQVSDPAFNNQPFAQVDVYACNVFASATCTGGQLILVATNTLASVTDVGTVRTYTYTTSGVALVGGKTNNFFAVGRNAAGDAVISAAATVVNP